jgi:cytochrome c biogenesis protein CcmG, thiol:disulfide interchange protein DsbE
LRLAIAAVCIVAGIGVLWAAGVLSRDETGDNGVPVQAASVDIVTSPVQGRSVGLGEGNVAPDFEFSSFEGTRMKLSDLRGRPVLVNFWASWCLPCRAEMPDIEGALQSYAPQQFAAVGVNNGERYKTAQEFLDRIGAKFTAFAYDAEARIAKRYAVQGMPTSYFIDAQGVITLVVLGPLTPPVMENGVKSAIAGAR